VNEGSAGHEQRGRSSRGIILGPGEGYMIPGTDAITLKATGEETGGSIGFLEATSAPGYGPPRHVHRSSDELFYVLEGEFLFLVGEREVSAPPGTFVFIPRGRYTPPRSSAPSRERSLWPTYRGAWRGPSRSSLRHAPSGQKA
jgi:mannose-6-phosphate isomerase-like protein (cupin superfamily)